MNAALLAAALLVGCLLAVQASVNLQLNKAVGTPYGASTVQLGVATGLLLVLAAVSGSLGALGKIPDVEWWHLLGGLASPLYITSGILLFPRLGALASVGLFVTGQMFSSLVLDLGGLFGLERQGLSPGIALGALAVLLGIIVIIRGQQATAPPGAPTMSGPGRIGWIALGIVAGGVLPVQGAVNAELRLLRRRHRDHRLRGRPTGLGHRALPPRSARWRMNRPAASATGALACPVPSERSTGAAMNTTRATRSRTRHRRFRLAAALPALALGAALSVALPTAPAAAAARVDNPYVGATPYVNPDWSARAAAEPGGAAIADEPSFVWMDRIAAITGTATSRGLRAHLDTALTQGASLFQVVIYDLPGRDCAALASNGELKAEELDKYKTQYIDPISAILSDPQYASLRIVALIEPDSLPNIVTNAGSAAGATEACRHVKQLGSYEKGVGYALNKLGDIENVYNYVNAGHHGWLGWDTNFDPAVDEFKLAATSEGATVDDVHGFIVNTANYSALKEPHFKVTDTVNGQTVRQAKWVDWNFYVDELSFAQALRDRLVSRGGFNSTIGMLIDTARNGWGGSARPAGPGPTTSVDAYADGSRTDRRIHAGNWCNQVGAGVGERPTTAPEPGIDAYVWAKPPGESDGNSQPVENDEGKGFDRMCGPTYEGNGRNGNSPTGAMADAPLAGHWFSAQFQMLLANAYPPIGGGGPGGDTQAPSVPTGPRVTGTTSSSASLAWTASTDNVGVTAYDVYRDGVQVGATSGTTLTDSGLSAATTYGYRVRARDAAGNASAQSAAVSATTTSGGTGGGSLKVQYKTSDTNATDNAIRMTLQLVNTGSSAQSLSWVEIRYWFGDSAASYTTWCDWAQPGCANLTHSVAANGSATGADHYLKANLSGGSLAAGASTGEIQLRVHKSDWSTFNEADDYSHGTSDWPRA